MIWMMKIIKLPKLKMADEDFKAIQKAQIVLKVL